MCEVIECGSDALLQYCDLASAVHHCQFIRKAFFFSDCDYAFFVLFLGLIYYLDGLPEGDMTLISNSKYAIQKA